MKSLKKPTANQKGLKKLPRAVRNKMGYAKDGMKYENGGKNDPKKKKKKRMYFVNPKQNPELAKVERNIWKMKDADKSTAGKASVSSDDASLEQSLREDGHNYKKDKHGQKLAPRTMMPKGPKNKGTRFRNALRGGDQDWRKQKYEVPNKQDKSLKGRTSGKSGNVGSGIKLDPKKKRRR